VTNYSQIVIDNFNFFRIPFTYEKRCNVAAQNAAEFSCRSYGPTRARLFDLSLELQQEGALKSRESITITMRTTMVSLKPPPPFRV
jgi:hypothetical protein